MLEMLLRSIIAVNKLIIYIYIMFFLINVFFASCLSPIKSVCLLLQGLKTHLLEIDKLENHICDVDYDDFDLRVDPAKQKLKDAASHLLRTNGHIMSTDSCNQHTVDFTDSTEEPPVRSPKARDLLSFLSDETHNQNVQPINTEQQQIQAGKNKFLFFVQFQLWDLFFTVEHLPEVKEIDDDTLTPIQLTSNHTICEESLENLNQVNTSVGQCMYALCPYFNQKGIVIQYGQADPEGNTF